MFKREEWRPIIIINYSNLLMEKQSGIAYYNLDTLCSEAVHRNFKGEGNTVS